MDTVKKTPVALSLLTVNTYVGRVVGTPDRAREFAKTVNQYDITCLQEVSPKAVARVYATFEKTHHVVPLKGRKYRGRQPRQVFLLAKRERFDLMTSSNAFIHRWLGGGPKGALRPNRNVPIARLLDKLTGRVVIPHGIHTVVDGRPGTTARKFHRQVIQYAVKSVRKRHAQAVVFLLGDFNEKMANSGTWARKHMTTAGLTIGFTSKVDGIFTRKAAFISQGSAKVFTVPWSDHKAIGATFYVIPR